MLRFSVYAAHSGTVEWIHFKAILNVLSLPQRVIMCVISRTSISAVLEQGLPIDIFHEYTLT